MISINSTSKQTSHDITSILGGYGEFLDGKAVATREGRPDEGPAHKVLAEHREIQKKKDEPKEIPTEPDLQGPSDIERPGNNFHLALGGYAEFIDRPWVEA